MADNITNNFYQGSHYIEKQTVYQFDKVEPGAFCAQFNHHPHFGSTPNTPRENDYNGARQYAQERMQNDSIFKNFWNKSQWRARADYLTDIFGWEVNEHHLNVNWNRHNK